MKKLFFILAFFTIVAMVNAQGVSADVNVWTNTNYGSYTGTAADTISGTTTADATFRIHLAKESRYTLSYMISGDTLEGCNGNVTIQPQGSYDGVTYTNIGSSSTWTTTANYDANASVNTYAQAYTGTLTTAAYTITQDTTGLTYITDSISVGAQTQTDARTLTTTLPGLDYNYIKILLTGASSAYVELQSVAVKVTPVSVPR
jgi:hypothetical protein